MIISLVFRYFNEDNSLRPVELTLDGRSPHKAPSVKDCVKEWKGCVGVPKSCAIGHFPFPPREVEDTSFFTRLGGYLELSSHCFSFDMLWLATEPRIRQQNATNMQWELSSKLQWLQFLLLLRTYIWHPHWGKEGGLKNIPLLQTNST